MATSSSVAIEVQMAFLQTCGGMGERESGRFSLSPFLPFKEHIFRNNT
jgi:hypothetical protein